MSFWHHGDQGEMLPRFYGWAAWDGTSPRYWACPVPFNLVYSWFNRVRWSVKCGLRPRSVDLLREEVVMLRGHCEDLQWCIDMLQPGEGKRDG
jgi:hypothetical protein